MSERTEYDPGTPCWIDLTTPDVEAAKAFYGAAFGWTAEDIMGPDDHLIYVNLRKDGKLVAGMGPQQDGMSGMPAMWSTYICVEDAEQTAKAAEAAGGSIMMPAMQVMDAGSMAFIGDPTGAAVGVWQPGDHKGAEVVNEPDTYSWNELLTRDVDAAKAFYAEVFGWTYDAQDMGPMGTYHVVEGGEEGGLAGLMAMPPGMPDELPSYWGVYFTVADMDATLAKLADAGATVLNGPMDTMVGIMTTVQDPHGATFTVMKPAEM